MKPAIIVPAFSRPDSLNNLLCSINSAYYPNGDINLIISLDGGYNNEVLRIAENFNFRSGPVEVVRRDENIGLRDHILWCGDQSEKYGSVIILEDDILVDRYYYFYAAEALRFYNEENTIAGIALYNYMYNPFARLPFEPLNNSFTNYFMQVVCSWGQAWSFEQWSEFKRWYNKYAREYLFDNIQIPGDIRGWPGTSWKKYFTAYIIEEGKFFTFPYRSYSTNTSAPGGFHIEKGSKLYQVPLSAYDRPKDELRFCNFDKYSVRYDSYMESLNEELFINLNCSKDILEVDIYGIKPFDLINRKKYVLTSRKCKPYIKSFEVSFRPIEKFYLRGCPSVFGLRLFLAESGNIYSFTQPYTRLAQYFSYYEVLDKQFLKGLIIPAFKKLLDKIR